MSEIKKVFMILLESESRETEIQILKFVESYREGLAIDYLEVLKSKV